jgi:hypothetical protein
MKRLVLAAPSYGAVDPELQKYLRVAMMYAASNGVQWIGDVSSLRMGWVGGRNASAKGAIESRTLEGLEADGVFWVDDDVKLVTMDVIARLVSYDVDFVTGIVFQKEPPHYPLIASYSETLKGSGFKWWYGFLERVLAPVDGAGFGCMYTSTKMLKAIAELPDFPKDGWFNQSPIPGTDSEGKVPTPLFSEDFSFCLRARQAGFQLLVDTAILCEHYRGPKYATVEDFRREHADKLAAIPAGMLDL